MAVMQTCDLHIDRHLPKIEKDIRKERNQMEKTLLAINNVE